MAGALQAQRLGPFSLVMERIESGNQVGGNNNSRYQQH